MTLVLASASQARGMMLERAGIAVLCDPASLDEAAVKCGAVGKAPAEVASLLAELKAREVSARHPGALVIGSDQMLECEGACYDKPATVAEARAQLTALRGRSHTLTSAAVILRDDRVLWRHAEAARLTMRAFSDDFLNAYLDQAGATICQTVGCYRIEGPGLQLFSRVEGDHFVILGLPLLALLAALRDLGGLKS